MFALSDYFFAYSQINDFGCKRFEKNEKTCPMSNAPPPTDHQKTFPPPLGSGAIKL